MCESTVVAEHQAIAPILKEVAYEWNRQISDTKRLPASGHEGYGLLWQEFQNFWETVKRHDGSAMRRVSLGLAALFCHMAFYVDHERGRTDG